MRYNPIYDINKDYLENAEKGPFFQGKIPQRVYLPKDQWIDFLGFKVASRIGVPAGPLLNSRWVSFAALMGFDIVTYKTIRSRFHPAHPLPNMIYVDTKGSLTEGRLEESLMPAKEEPRSFRELAVTNSFGIPSRDPDYVVADIAKAKKSLHEGQVMIVSVVGTPREGEDYVEDFAQAARLAVQAGADIVEADLSCPNLAGSEGSLYTNPDSVFQITKRIHDSIGDKPLIIKVGALFDRELLRLVMKAAVRGGAQAICGINTVSMKLVNEDGSPTLGKNRMKAGVCGGPIREAALHFLRNAHAINQEEKLGLTIMGTGGVTAPEHFDDFLELGADVAMSAVGMIWDPYLANKYHERQNGSGN
ncbi:MAG: hypothetical protein ACKVOH_01850 [Chlamydiales bacterium]